MGPSSARKSVTLPPRRLLLDTKVIERAFESNEAPDDTQSELDGETWAMRFRPIFSPRTNTLVGLLAAVTKDPEALPAPPLVGSWEWEIKKDAAGNPTPERRTFWDQNLFRLYDVAPGIAEQKAGYWEVGVWQNDLVAQSDQLRIFGSVRDGIREKLEGPKPLTFHVNTGYGRDKQGTKKLRLVGWIAATHPEGVLVLQGFSYEVPEWFSDMAFEQDAARVDDVLRGMMELSGEPMAVVDPDTLEILMTSPAWRAQPFGRQPLYQVLSSDAAAAELRTFLLQSTQSETASSFNTRLNGCDALVRVTPVRAGSTSGDRDALVRVELS